MDLSCFSLDQSELQLVRDAYRRSAGASRPTLRYVVLRDLPDGRTAYAVVAARYNNGVANGRRILTRVILVTHCDARPGDVSYCGSVIFCNLAGWRINWDDGNVLYQLNDKFEAGISDRYGLADGMPLSWGRFAGLADTFDVANCRHLLQFLRRFTSSQEAAAVVRAGFWSMSSPSGLAALGRRPGMVAWMRKNASWIRKESPSRLDLCWMYDHAAGEPVTRAYRMCVYARSRRVIRDIATVAGKYAGMEGVRRGKYTVVLPRSISDLVEEGRAMHNCVGGYGNKIAQGKCVVAFIRRSGTPYADVEISPEGNVRQCLSAHNKNAVAAAWDVSRELARIVRAVRRKAAARLAGNGDTLKEVAL